MPEFASRLSTAFGIGTPPAFDMSRRPRVSFGLGDPDFQPPPAAIEAMHRAMCEGRNKYTTTAGLPALREAIADDWKETVTGLEARHICVTMSGTSALFAVFACIARPGGNILIPELAFPVYEPDILLWGGEVRRYPTRSADGFVPDIDSLESLVDGQTTAIVCNYPSNPTGATIDVGSRDAILEFARRHDLWVVSDEVYRRMVFEGMHVSFLGAGYDRVVVIDSFSKTFCMTGWRIGYALSTDLSFMERLTRVVFHMAGCPNDAMQYGVLAALREAPEFPAMVRDAFRRRRDLICERMAAIRGVSCRRPMGAFYVFPALEAARGGTAHLVDRLLQGGVLTTPGTAFGTAGEGHLRLSYAVTEQSIAEGMDIFERVLAGIAGS